jgi:hypothetical protein
VSLGFICHRAYASGDEAARISMDRYLADVLADAEVVEPIVVLSNNLPSDTPDFDDIADGPDYDIVYLIWLSPKSAVTA